MERSFNQDSALLCLENTPLSISINYHQSHLKSHNYK